MSDAGPPPPEHPSNPSVPPGQPPGRPPVQPPPPGYGWGGPALPPGGPPESYLVWSILTTVFCCLPLGIVSIVYAGQVNSKWSLGDVAGARESSRKARQFAFWGAIVGAIVLVLVIVLYAIVIVAAVNSGSSSDFDTY